jgi:hypothetical protein
MPELTRRRLVRHRLGPQIDPDELPPQISTERT